MRAAIGSLLGASHDLFGLNRLRPQYWTVPREWDGSTSFIVAGGPSVRDQNTEQLRGKRVIAINSSWRRVPFADVLFFGDKRWWDRYGTEVQENGFSGRIVTCAGEIAHPLVWNLRKEQPPGLMIDPACVWMRRTSLTAAINLAFHFGAKRIVLLGADGGPASDGTTHHHESYPWDQTTNCWQNQRDDLAKLVKPLQAHGLEVLNASPGSSLDFWPIVHLNEIDQ